MTRSLLIIPFVLIIIFYPGLSTTFSQLSFCCLLLERASRKWKWFSYECRPVGLMVTDGLRGRCAAVLAKCQQEGKQKGGVGLFSPCYYPRDTSWRRSAVSRSRPTLRPHPCCFFYSFFKAFCEKWLRYFKKIILSVIWIQLIIQEGEWV